MSVKLHEVTYLHLWGCMMLYSFYVPPINSKYLLLVFVKYKVFHLTCYIHFLRKFWIVFLSKICCLFFNYSKLMWWKYFFTILYLRDLFIFLNSGTIYNIISSIKNLFLKFLYFFIYTLMIGLIVLEIYTFQV